MREIWYNHKTNLYSAMKNGIVAATAQCSRETGQSAAVSLVYIRPESRGKGYASALIAFISKRILEKEKTPVLYTDLSNPFSNKAYKNVGFIEKGRVDEGMLARKG
ncbi:MAG: GNAT family N-acetyltransferase [Lacrimispora sp.]